MTPDQLPPNPACPICGKEMVENHRRRPPTMCGKETIYAYKWDCRGSDERGNGHYVEITKRKDGP